MSQMICPKGRDESGTPTPLAEPSDYERSLWPKATDEYVEALETKLDEAVAKIDTLENDNTGHGYALNVLQRAAGVEQNERYDTVCEVIEKLKAELDSSQSARKELAAALRYGVVMSRYAASSKMENTTEFLHGDDDGPGLFDRISVFQTAARAALAKEESKWTRTN